MDDYLRLSGRQNSEADAMTHHISKSDRYWQNWDNGEAAKRIDRYWLESEKGWRDMLGADIRGELGRPDRVLEVGCGSGLIFQAMLDNRVVTASSYVGGDVSRKMLSIARKRFPDVSFIDLDVLDIEYPDRSWPAVISVQVLQHLPYYDRAISELMRITRDVLYLVSWFNTGLDDELVFSAPSEMWDGQAFQNNYYSLPRFLTHILNTCARPLASLKVRRLVHQTYSVSLVFGDPVPQRRSFFDRLTRYANTLLRS